MSDSEERTFSVTMELVLDPEKGWCYKALHMKNGVGTFDTEAERDDLIKAAEQVVRLACSAVFTKAQAIEMRNRAVAGVRIWTSPELHREAVDAVLAADSDRAAQLLDPNADDFTPSSPFA